MTPFHVGHTGPTKNFSSYSWTFSGIFSWWRFFPGHILTYIGNLHIVKLHCRWKVSNCSRYVSLYKRTLWHVRDIKHPQHLQCKPQHRHPHLEHTFQPNLQVHFQLWASSPTNQDHHEMDRNLGNNLSRLAHVRWLGIPQKNREWICARRASLFSSSAYLPLLLPRRFQCQKSSKRLFLGNKCCLALYRSLPQGKLSEWQHCSWRHTPTSESKSPDDHLQNLPDEEVWQGHMPGSRKSGT